MDAQPTSCSADESKTKILAHHGPLKERRTNRGGQLFAVKSKPLPPASLLHEHLLYDHQTGQLIWKKPNGRNVVGGVAGKPSGPGKTYWSVGFGGEVYLAHRLIWRMVTGNDPGEMEIDHRNRNRKDNRWENLRLASGSNNCCNQSLKSTNTSGVKGISWHKASQKWQAYVDVNQQRTNLGLFPSVEAAAEAVRKKREELHGEFASH